MRFQCRCWSLRDVCCPAVAHAAVREGHQAWRPRCCGGSSASSDVDGSESGEWVSEPLLGVYSFPKKRWVIHFISLIMTQRPHIVKHLCAFEVVYKLNLTCSQPIQSQVDPSHLSLSPLFKNVLGYFQRPFLSFLPLGCDGADRETLFFFAHFSSLKSADDTPNTMTVKRSFHKDIFQITLRTSYILKYHWVLVTDLMMQRIICVNCLEYAHCVSSVPLKCVPKITC